MRMKRWLIAAVIAVAFLLVAKHLLLDTPADPRGTYAIDLDALHRAATSAGPLPQSIEVEKVGEFAFPETLVLAGHGYRMHRMVLLAHRVVWPDRSVVVDTAMSPEAAKKMPGSSTDAAAFARVEKAMSASSAIVFTHEHADHVGGVASAPDFSGIAKKVRMTSEQLASAQLERGAFPAGALDQLVPLSYEGLYTLAPGVVLQKAPGHSPGSQLLYVELASGARFLFVGDVAWSEDNVRQETGRPGLATLLMKEDRPAVAAQLHALAALPRDVHLIVAHDPVALERDLQAHLYKMGFTVD